MLLRVQKEMYKTKRKRKSRLTYRKRLTVTLTSDDQIEIDYDPKHPPVVFFDTNVIRGLSESGILALRRLQDEQGFRYLYSMLNFVELASHLGDPPSDDAPDPFRKFQSAFQKLNLLFDTVLPSAETVFMQALGLKHYLGPKWIVDPASIRYQIRLIAEAASLEDILKAGIDPGHYKKLREVDGEAFLGLVAEAKKTIKDPRNDLDAGGKWLRHVYSFLIYRASSRRKHFETLKDKEKHLVIKFFDKGGKMFLSHLLKLLIKTIRDGAKEDANDFYDMLQLILLHDPDLLFVTDDRPFFQYYVGPAHHRVVPWKLFKVS